MTEILFQPIVLVLLIPIAAGCVCLLLPKSMERLIAVLAALAAALTMVFAWRIFLAPPETFDFPAGVSFRVDALSGFIVLATSAFGFLVAVYSGSSHAVRIQGRRRIES